MTAEKMRSFAANAEVTCIAQETLPWGGSSALIDCLSVLTKPDSKWACGMQFYENREFGAELRYLARLSRLYGRKRFIDQAG